MKLTNIIEYLKPVKTINAENTDIEIKGVSYNSKQTKSGDIFVCLVGEHVDGHNYAKQAVENGAIAVITQKPLELSVPVIIVKDTQYELSRVANYINGLPSTKLNLVGVTGTNGKTTVTHLIENIFEKAGFECGLIGTLGQRLSTGAQYTDAKHTTPQAPELQSTLKKMVDNGIKNVVMEVSSHSIEQHRVGGCEFNGAVITNLTQDHLDYHITMQNYFEAKSKLFTRLKPNSYAVINNDDKWAAEFKKAVPEKVKTYTYGIKNNADVMAKNIQYSVSGCVFDCTTPVGTKKINLQMAGLFSVYNALAALSAGIAEGIEFDICIKALEATQSVAGRFEVVSREPLAIVDYAHTPDGLENVLKAAKELVPDNGNLICLFGCGGDRDATKRPQMARIAEELSDKIVITSDNPRSEDPQQIITDVLTGIKSLNSNVVHVEIDRKYAIEYAIKNAQKNDVIVVAGKGHEDYQVLKDETIHFDDREEVKKAIAEFQV